MAVVTIVTKAMFQAMMHLHYSSRVGPIGRAFSFCHLIRHQHRTSLRPVEVQGHLYDDMFDDGLSDDSHLFQDDVEIRVNSNSIRYEQLRLSPEDEIL